MNWMAFGGLAALGTLLTAGWSYVRMIWDYLSSFVIERIEIVDSERIHMIVPYYFENHFKRIRFGSRLYGIYGAAIKNYSPEIFVGVEEIPSTTAMYIRNHYPIWLSRTQSLTDTKSAGGSIAYSVTYLRYTFNADELIKSISKYWSDDIIRINKGTKKEFYTQHVVGTKSKHLSVKQSLNEIPTSIEPSRPSRIYDKLTLRGRRLLGYDLKDIGFKECPSKNPTIYISKELADFEKKLSRFLDSSEWFFERDIPWRMGAVFYGLPGTGKTKSIRYLGKKYNLPVISFDLSSMDNSSFKESIDSLFDFPCILLFEDFDNIFHGRTPANDNIDITFDAILQAIDGVKSLHGIITIITTNDINKLDPAFGGIGPDGISLRPGRIDHAVKFGYLCDDGKKQIAQSILLDLPELQERAIKESLEETGASFERRCIDLAFEHFNSSYSP